MYIDLDIRVLVQVPNRSCPFPFEQTHTCPVEDLKHPGPDV